MAPQSPRHGILSPPAHRRSRRVATKLGRLRFEQLEDRTAPALFNVQTPVNLGGTKNFGCIATGDFNGDGKTDMVLTNYGTAGPGASPPNNAGGNTISILLGTGTGTFGSATTMNVGTDQYVSFVAVGDLNGDGKQDLAVVSNNEDATGVLRIYLGNGTGGFTLSSQGAISTQSSNACWVGIAQVTNGDTNPDVVVASFGNSDQGQTTVFGNNISVFQGDGTGAVNLINTIANGLSFIPTALALADFNGDGKLDIAATVPGVPPDSTSPQPNGIIQMFNGNGAGGFTAGNSFDSGGALPINIQTTDLNGDGLPDLVIANAGDPDAGNGYANFGSNSSIGVALNTGGGNFNTLSPLTAGLGVSGSKAVFAVAASDFNLDGHTDIAAIVYGNPLSGANAHVLEFKGDGAGGFSADVNSPFNTTATGGQYLAAAPLDANSSPDIVYCTDSASYGVLLNTSVPGVSTTTSLVSSLNPSTSGTAVTFTATVTASAGNATGGTVTFFNNGVQLGSPVNLASQQAQLTTSALTVGSHNITATYSGASGFTGSTTTTPLSQVVNAATTPSVTIAPAGGQPDPTNASPISYAVHFSESVTGLTASGVSFTGSTVGGTLVAGVSGSGQDYTVTVTGMSGTGTVVASIPAGAAHNGGGTGNTASNSSTVNFDNVTPTVTINQGASQSDPATGPSVTFDVVFGEAVVGFNASKVDLTGTTAPGATVSVSGSGPSYTVTVSGMTAGGTITAAIDAGVVADPAGNPNAASTSNDNTITYVRTPGTVQFSASTYSIDETGAPTLTVTVTRTGGSDGPLTVNYAAADGTAKIGTDYGAPSGTGTLSWAAGDATSKTFTVPILDDGTLEAGKAFTVNLSGISFTGSLGSPATATVNILEGASLGFSAANYNVNEGDGTVTVTVQRLFDSTGAVSVQYATSDGTAVSTGAVPKYAPKSNTLSWADGDSTDKTFTVPITHVTLSEGNLKFNLTLSAVTGNANLGLGTATVTIAKHHPMGSGSTFTDADGDLASVKLTGPGVLKYYLTDGKGPIAEIDMTGTDSGKSTLSLKDKKPKGGTGDGRVQIGEIDGTGVKSLSLAKADLTGAGINLIGFLKSLTIGAIKNGADITLAGAPPKPGQTVKITAGVIGDGTDINITGAPLGSLTAISVGVGSIEAPSVGSINIKGKPKTKTTPAISGDFKSSLTIAGTGLAAKVPALKSFRAAGTVSGAAIVVGGAAGTVGDVGSVSVGSFVNSTLFAGYTGPDNGSGSFNLPSVVKSFKVSGKTDAFANSDVIASSIKTVNLTSIKLDNGGVTYGIVGHTFIGTVTVTFPQKFTYPGEFNLGDFAVNIV